MDSQNKDPPSHDDEISRYPTQQNVDSLHQGKYPPHDTTIPLQNAYPPQGTTIPLQNAYPPQGTTIPLQNAYPPQGTTIPLQNAYSPQFPPPRLTYTHPLERIYPDQDDIYDDIVGAGNCTIDTQNLIPVETLGLSDTKGRHCFIRKVLLILCVHFGIVVASIFLMQHFVGTLDDDYYTYAYHSDLQKKVTIAMWSCFAIAFVLGSVLLIHEIRRKHPINIILLILFTLAMSGFVGCVTVFFEAQIITIFMVCTCIITLSLALFACQTRIDYNMSKGPFILAFLMILLSCIGFYMLYVYYLHYFELEPIRYFIGCICVFIYNVFLVIDMRRLIGRKEYLISAEEYVFGALTIYFGVIIRLLRLILALHRVFRCR